MSNTVKSIYTDGACSGNPGPGGWGVVIYFEDGSVHELGGYAADTTNNRMELQATIAGLDYLQTVTNPGTIPLYTDSQYVKKGITQWLSGWKRKGWKTAKGQPVLNKDLWEQLDALNSHQVDWRYVRGHSGNIGNDRCDEIARGFSTGRRPHLQQQGAKADAPPQNLDPPIQAADQTLQSQPLPQSQIKSLPRQQTPTKENRVPELHTVLEKLRMAHEIASEGYLLTSAELAALTAQPPTDVDQCIEPWVWRNWTCKRVDATENESLWQLQRR